MSKWDTVWPMSSLVQSAKDASTYGFTDFNMDARFPALQYLSTRYERSWDDFSDWALFFRRNWYLTIAVSVLYLIAIPVGKRLMAKREAFDLKYPLFLWNAGLAVFSIIGVVRVVPALLYGIFSNGPMYFVCRNAAVSYGRGSLGLWCTLFVLSKYAELVDTLFLILRKKQVPFLHWFHHASVLLISVGTIMVTGPTGIIMIAMNFFVHSIMYTYYAIAAIAKPPRWGKTVTVLQIAQMVGGLLMSGAILWGAKTVKNCDGQPANGYGIAFIYLSYLILFVRFYIGRYIANNARSASKKDE